MENNVVETNKNKNLIIGVMACIIVLLIAALVYFIFIKKDKPEEPVKPQDNQQVDKMLSNEEALNVAKEKLNSALNFWEDFDSFDEDKCKDNIGDWFCYYDAEDNFKNKFYNKKKKKITFKDVFDVCENVISSNDDFNSKCKTNIEGGLSEDHAELTIKNKKVYVANHCTIGSGFVTLKGNYEIKNVTSDRIVMKYVLTQGSEIPEVEKDVDYDEEIVLVKEDNNWKIEKVTIIGICNGAIEVGK